MTTFSNLVHFTWNSIYPIYLFQISDVVYGKVINVDLIPNGSDVPVTKSNRKKFVDLYVKYILVDSVAKQFDAFARGFHKVSAIIIAVNL